jgi:soluble lytic murein transglycosylase-like protein
VRHRSVREYLSNAVKTAIEVRWRFATLCLVLGVLVSPARAEPADKSKTTAVATVTVASVPPPAAPVLRSPDSRAAYRMLIEREVRGTTLPADVADAVMGVESGYNPSRIGGDGEIGLMQLMPPTARMLGFSGTLAELAVPEVNIRLGVTYLAQAWSRAGGDLCTALMKYRAGHGETRFSHLSVEYCLRARSRLAAMGYPVTGSVPVATFGTPGGGGGGLGTSCRRKCFAFGSAGRVDFAALNTRLTQVVTQVNLPRMAGK